MNSKRRLERIEKQIGTTEENEYTMQEFAGDVLAAVADGHICDHGPELAHMALVNPTVADGLDAVDHTRAWGLLNESQKTVAEIARFTGWRSQAADVNRAWTGFRANSTAELRAMMAEIMNYATT